MRRVSPAFVTIIGFFVFGRAFALEVGKVANKPMTLDVTNSSVVAQQFDARETEGQSPLDYGYGSFLNRLNVALRWYGFTAGMRLDSSVYWRRPKDRDNLSVTPATVERDGSTRFRNAVYPAKMWLTYDRPGLEVTAGDAYAQFGRGLALSMRKLDDLGVDTTLRGGKVQWQKDPFAVTFLAGFANPSRVDEATARTLFLREALASSTLGPQPVFGSDRLYGAEAQLGRGWPVTVAVRGVRFDRCAPYRYDDKGRIIDNGLLSSPFGSCDSADKEQFGATLPNDSPGAASRHVDMLGASIEVPNLWKHGKFYLEGAYQRREPFDSVIDKTASNFGNAVYAGATVTVGITTHTLEVKSYRNFYPVLASVDISYAPELSTVAYSAIPTAELITQDNMYGSFNACVNGGRYRVDVKLLKNFFVYGQAIYAHSKSEIAGGRCDELGHTIVPKGTDPNEVHARVVDGLTGFEWQFDNNRSQLFVSAGARSNDKDNGEFYYRETSFQYTFTKYIKGPYSFELTGRHRQRREEDQNVRDKGVAQPWTQGEHYTAFKIAPKWVFSQGIEYTTQIGFPTYYFNGVIVYRFTSNSSVRLFAGQQRGGLRCVSGICRFFPAYEGVRADLTLRF